MSAILCDRFPFAYNQIIYVISIQFHVLLTIDHFYGLSSVFNAKVVSFIIVIMLCFLYIYAYLYIIKYHDMIFIYLFTQLLSLIIMYFLQCNKYKIIICYTY